MHAGDLVAAKVSGNQIVEVSLPDDTALTAVREADCLVMYQVPPLAMFATSQPPEIAFQVRFLSEAVYIPPVVLVAVSDAIAYHAIRGRWNDFIDMTK